MRCGRYLPNTVYTVSVCALNCLGQLPDVDNENREGVLQENFQCPTSK